MNILFIGPYRQNDEWGRKSQSILNTLQQNTDHVITSRPIYLSSSVSHNTYMEKAESTISNYYDLLIQFTLPQYATYYGAVKKRIGIFNTETIPNNIPVAQLTADMLMDEIWTDSQIVTKQYQKLLNHHNCNAQVITIPPSLNLTDLPIQYNSSLRSSVPLLKDRFIFYYIGDITDIKDAFYEVYTAYITEFTQEDPVALVVGIERSLPSEQIQNMLKQCRTSLALTSPEQQYPLVHIITPNHQTLSTEERLTIHIDADCMVGPHYTMIAHSKILEGALYHNTPIVNSNSAIQESLGNENVWSIDSYEETCMVQPNAFVYRFTNGESWYKPIIKSLARTLRIAYTDKFQRDKKIKANSKLRQYFQTLSYNKFLTLEI